MKEKSIDIFVLTYHRLHYLKVFIEMLYLSTDYPFRLFVISNDKDDIETNEFILKLEKEKIIYKHLFNEKNLPLAAALTACFNKFKDELNEYIITVADDMLPVWKDPCWLTVFKAKMDSDENIGCVNFVSARCSYDGFNRKMRPRIEARIKAEGGKRLELFNKLQKLIN